MIRIDKSAFTPDELATYNELIAKATVKDGDPAPAPAIEPMQKSDTPAPELAAALARLETLEKSIEMNEYREIAKKYAILGENEEELAKTLHTLKKSNEESYKAYIAVLDKSVGIVEKSGIFTEIGKSIPGTAGGAVEQIEAAAVELMKSDATLSHEDAIVKAYENNPQLAAEYDASYKMR